MTNTVAAATIVLLLVLVLPPPLPNVQETEATALAGQSLYKLPKLFDFEYFKSLYGKHYPSVMEEQVRQRYFLSRALRAYVSGVNYWRRLSASFNAINNLSDKTLEEVDMMRNKNLDDGPNGRNLPGLLDEGQEAGEKKATTREEGENHWDDPRLPELLPVEGENVERELIELIEEHGEEPEFKPLRDAMVGSGRSARRKRAAGELEVNVLGPRKFSLDMLINTGQLDEDKSAPMEQYLLNPKPNNPFYKLIELASMGLSDQEESIKFWKHCGDHRDGEPAQVQLKKVLEYSEKMEPSTSSNAKILPDKVFFDHRKGGCLTTPRNQGNCGACYAFSVTSVMEWLLCQKTGKLVELSEQYMIDCGYGRFNPPLKGCSEGGVKGAGMFVHNFGVELLKNYPFMGKETKCPYKEDYDLKKTGFFRMDIGNMAVFHMSRWHQIIEKTPFYVKAKTGKDFLEYGRGVYEGNGCSDKPNHGMVMVGHGRQDGRHYWLIRNSYGHFWGDGGYWRLAKTATTKCLEGWGYTFGTKNGSDFDVVPRNSGPKVHKSAAAKQAAAAKPPAPRPGGR